MQSADDPRRLLDEPDSVPDDLRAGLERMSGNLPDAERLARLAASLGIATAPPEAPPSPAGQSIVAKVVIGTGVLGIVAAGAFYTLSGEHDAADRAPVPSHETASLAPASSGAEFGARAPASQPGSPKAPAAALEPSPESPPASASAATGEGEKPSAEPREATRDEPKPRSIRDVPEKPRTATSEPQRPSASAPATSRVTSSSVTPGAATVPTETELLRDARLALERDPSQALALSEKHRHEYPNGGFSQERELIAITALARLGRTADAQTRAERFRSAYPRSPYMDRVNRVVPR